mmetsp:Transcript_7338/g.22365  ORF Transcript_7338/g.22365 Transcript_7338/m.22365 type:complete len:719 (+) Transcript_7338:142-2298(+)
MGLGLARMLLLLVASCSIALGQKTAHTLKGPTFDPYHNGTSEAEPPIVREAQGAMVDGVLYLFGGFIPWPQDTTKLFKIMTTDSWKWAPYEVGGTDGNWSRLTDMPINFYGNTHCGNTVDYEKKIIYISGGLALPLTVAEVDLAFADAVSTSTFLAYSIEDDTWDQLEDIPYPVGGGAAVYSQYDGRLHVVSGTQSQGDHDIFFRDWEPINIDLPNHWAYDPVNDSWTELESTTVIRNHITATYLGSKIYVVGGQILTYESCANVAVVECYDTSLPDGEGYWTKVQTLPAGRGHIGGSLLPMDNHILLIGGTEDKPNKCMPAGTHDTKGLVFHPDYGWGGFQGATPTGPSMVCGVTGEGKVRHLYCNTQFGVQHLVFAWRDIGKFAPFVPELTGDQQNAVKTLKKGLITLYQDHFVGRTGSFNYVDVRPYCRDLADPMNYDTKPRAGARYTLTMTQIFDTLDSFSVRRYAEFENVTFEEDYAFKTYAASWFGLCSAELYWDTGLPSVMSARRDLDTLDSVQDVRYFEGNINLHNNGVGLDSLSLCAFSKREMYANFIRGFVPQWIAFQLQGSELEEQFITVAEELCDVSTSWLVTPKSECDRGVGAAAFLIKVQVFSSRYKFGGMRRTPFHGSFKGLGSADKDTVVAEALDLLSKMNQSDSTAVQWREFGLEQAVAQFMDYDSTSTWTMDASWRDAFVRGLNVQWPSDHEPVSRPCSS